MTYSHSDWPVSVVLWHYLFKINLDIYVVTFGSQWSETLDNFVIGFSFCYMEIKFPYYKHKSRKRHLKLLPGFWHKSNSIWGHWWIFYKNVDPWQKFSILSKNRWKILKISLLRLTLEKGLGLKLENWTIFNNEHLVQCKVGISTES